MRIEHVKIFPVTPSDSLVGFASMEVDGWLSLAGIGVHINSQQEFSLSFPTKKDSKGVEHRFFLPLTNEAREIVTRAVKDSWHESMKEVYKNESIERGNK